jgi:hypothetical protein
MWRGSCGHSNAARGSVAASGDVDARSQTMSIQSCSRLVEWARRAATGEDSLAADRRSRDGCGSRRVGVTHAMARTLVLRDSESGDGAGVVGELPATSACVVSLAGVVGLRAPMVAADAAQQMFWQRLDDAPSMPIDNGSQTGVRPHRLSGLSVRRQAAD